MKVGMPMWKGAGGEITDLLCSFEATNTALGPAANWPRALVSYVQMILELPTPAIIFWGPDQLQIYNEGYARIMGPRHPRYFGAPYRECWPDTFPLIYPLMQKVLSLGEVVRVEKEHIPVTRYGFQEEAYFSFTFSPLRDDEGKIAGILQPVLEVTDAVLSERRAETLRALTPRADSIDPRGDAFAALRDNLRDLPFSMLFQPEGRDAFELAGSTGCPEHNDLARALEASVRSASESHAPVEVHDLDVLAVQNVGPWPEPPRSALVLPIGAPGSSGRPAVLALGISARLRFDDRYRSFLETVAGQVGTALHTESALREAQKRAEALSDLDRAKTAFFANVSHEFRTPLTLMLAPQEQALASPKHALEGRELEAVHRNTLRLLKLVNTLLDFSRAEAGRANACYRPTDLGALTSELAAAFRSAIERAGLRFDVTCATLPTPVFVDRDMWEKIVLNLLSNAFKFTFEGSIAVTLRAAQQEVELVVKDTGTGIPEHELTRVFERFHRIENAKSRTHEGSGIGLALVQDLVKLHRGSIEVASELGVGTSFTVRVPLGHAHLPADRIVMEEMPLPASATAAAPFVAEAMRWLPESEAPATGALTEAHHAAVERRGPVASLRVLVVDDNSDMREYLGRVLGEFFHVEVAADGVYALERMAQAPPDLVLTDVMMPRLDGFGLLRAVREKPNWAFIPVIMLSARAGEEARVEGLEASADDYLVKPFSARELVARVRVHLELARLRQAAERERARLRSLLGQLPANVSFLRGPDLVIEYAHPAQLEALGGRDVLGKPLLEAIPELRDQEYPRLLERVFVTGERIEGREQPVHHYDPQGRLVEHFRNFVYLPVRDDEGNIAGVMTFDVEVTEQVLARRRVEEQASALAEANREAEQARHLAERASRAKDEFLAMLGHELRNPLSPIVTSLHVLRMRGVETREQTVIERQVRHLVRLVDDLLDVSRIASGKIELRRSRVQLGQVVLRGLEMASPLLEQRRQHVQASVPPEGLEIDGDADRLAQVFSNLLTNAAKYSEPGTTVYVRAERFGSRVRLSVRDEGIGIAPERVDKVFELFFQEPQSLDRAKGGLGLGLAIVRSLVELHGGHVWATSEGEGKGSEFVVDLPLASGTELVSGQSYGETAASGPPRTQAHPQKRVLVVDDNLDLAESIADLLREVGYEVETAGDGPEALQVAKRLKPHVCLVDIGLPVMDGYELAKRLKQSDCLPQGARLIAVTGYGQSRDRARSAEAGFHGHLVKPVSPDLLARELMN